MDDRINNLQKAVEYRAKARATSDVSVMTALEAVAREYARRATARGFQPGPAHHETAPLGRRKVG
jgi:hypothetical protein